jgi:Reverse transcriptase (RNA-dependent DNA polymerase)/Endonuclease-reverse transcriptase
MWNCRSLTPDRLACLQMFADTAQPLAIGVCESRLDPTKPDPSIPGYYVFNKPVSRSSRGVVLFVRQRLDGSIAASHRPDLECSTDSVVVDVRLSCLSSSFLLCLCYHHRTHSSSVSSKSWTDIKATMSACIRASSAALFFGDLNAHHSSWNHGNEDAFGRDLDRFCTSNALSNLNAVCCPGVPTFPKAKTTIDLAITSDPTVFASVSVFTDSSLISDHFPIAVRVPAVDRVVHDQPAQPRAVFDFDRADWASYVQLLDLQSAQASVDIRMTAARHRCSPAVAISKMCSIVQECIAMAQSQSVPQKHSNAKAKHWWSAVPGVPEALARLRRARRQKHRRKTAEARQEFRLAVAAWKAKVTEAKAASWDRFCNKIYDPATGKVNWRRLHAATHEPDTSSLASIANPGQPPPCSLAESLDRLGLYYSSVSSAPQTRPHDECILKFVNSYSSRKDAPGVLDSDFTLDKLNDECLRLFDCAPGPDNLSALLLKNAPDSFRRVLLQVFNFSWSHGVLPNDWLIAHVCAIYKRHRAPRNLPKSYRPISLTSAVVKLFERMVLSRLVQFLDSRNFFSQFQSGFRKAHSTADLIYRLIDRIQCAITNRSHVSVVFLDIASAFDRVWHAGLLFKLHRAGIRGKAWRWLQAFLSNRQLRVVSKGCFSRWFDVSAGVPQGSILGPFLFLVFINDIPTLTHTVMAIYADDVAVWSTHDDPDLADYNLQNVLNLIFHWSNTWHVSFSVPKSVAMRFSRCRVPRSLPVLQLGDAAISYVKIVRYLGVLFNPRLSWGPQCNQVISQTAYMAHRVSRIITATGPPPKLIRQLTRVLIESKMTYAWPLWQPPTVYHWRKLEAAVALPLRCSVGLPSSTHVPSVFAEFAIARPKLLFDAVALSFAHRVDCKLGSSDPAHPSHQLFKRQQRTVGFTKTNIPFAKFVKKVAFSWERELGLFFDHTNAECKSVAAFYPRAVARNIADLHAEESAVRYSRFAQHAEPPNYIMTDSRSNAILRARLRLNRHHFNELLYRAGGQSETPFCPSCPEAPESIDHVLLDCPLHNAARQLLRDALVSCDLPGLATLGGINQSQAIDVITGDLSLVPSAARFSVLSVTARFLQAINIVRPI